VENLPIASCDITLLPKVRRQGHEERAWRTPATFTPAPASHAYPDVGRIGAPRGENGSPAGPADGDLHIAVLHGAAVARQEEGVHVRGQNLCQWSGSEAKYGVLEKEKPHKEGGGGVGGEDGGGYLRCTEGSPKLGSQIVNCNKKKVRPFSSCARQPQQRQQPKQAQLRHSRSEGNL